MEATVVAGRRGGLIRWAPLGGLLYVVLFILGTIVMFSGAAGGDDPPAKVIEWYSDSGHRDRVNLGWIIAGLGVFFLLWFVAALRRSVSIVDGDGISTALVMVGGTIYTALAFASLALNAGVRTMSDDTYQHRVFPELIHAVDDAGYVMHATGAAGLGAMIIAASLAFGRSGLWPKWATWLGVFAGVCAVAAIFFFTQFVFMLWILIVSLVLFRRPHPSAVIAA